MRPNLRDASSISVLMKRCSENMYQIGKRAPMPTCDINKLALEVYLNHTLACVFCCKFGTCF